MNRKVLGEKQLPTQEVLPANDLMISGIRDSVFIADLNGKIVFANDQACKVHGYTKGEFKGLNVIDILVVQMDLILLHSLMKSFLP
ncbi:PAS domain S-box protein [Dehalococcoides mccartyi]|uniref:PAS domain S-box protein n=1 Tax=Dehalococcoides mccartyi TaxID=61435 RepID=UPI001F39FD95|nr:PAS domain S-box protein [Dehalococcoides mccartyi]